MKSFKISVFWGLLVSSLLLLSGCNTDPDDMTQYAERGIYGRVTDFATGEPVKNANVQLRPTGETTLTNSDGQYEFRDIAAGKYSLTVSKVEYTDLIDDYVITVADRMMKRDVQIRKNVAYLEVTDGNLNPITYLDFGIDAISRSFTVFNNGPVGIDCQVSCSCPWISEVTPKSCHLASGATQVIIVTIDRAKLMAGINTTYIHITSNNGNKELEIRATGSENLPSVTTLPVTSAIGSATFLDTFNAEVTKTGLPAYFERGFCYSSTNSMPTINDKCVTVSGTGLGKYSYRAYDLGTTTTTYYVRAWLKYGNNQIMYGNVQTFTYYDI